MRFDELLLRVPGEDEGLRIRFHEQLTVLSGVASVERQALVDAVVAAMTGGGDRTTLTCTDHTGRALELVSDGPRFTGRYLDDGTSAPLPVGWFAPDPAALRSLVVLTADDLGPDLTAHPRDDDPPELVEARELVEALKEELHTAEEGRQQVGAAEAELSRMAARIADAEANAAKREYAKAVAQLERVRGEAAVHQAGGHGADADRALLAANDEVGRLAGSWAMLVEASHRARRAIEADEPIEPAEVARLAEVPDAPPADLPAAVAAVVRTTGHVANLEDRLRIVASASLPDPDDPRVLGLATIDQAELWGAHARAVAASTSLQHEQVAVGGIGSDVGEAGGGERAVAIAELEAAHLHADRASNLIEQRRVPVIAAAGIAAALGVPVASFSPLLALVMCVAAAAGAVWGIGVPWRARWAAEQREVAALERVGVPTYLSFHLRRIDATLDPKTLDRLALAAAERETSQRAWAAVSGGGISVDDAATLEASVREYAAALASQHGAVQEVAELRRTLDELALPDRAAAKERLLLAVEPYGLGADVLEGLEPELVATFVAAQVALGHAARRWQALVDAEADEEKEARRLDDLLARLGFADGNPLPDRVHALRWALDRAREREEARVAARAPEVIEADLARLHAEVRRLHRPEWTDVAAAELAGVGVDIDVDALVADHRQLAAAIAAFDGASPEVVDRLHASLTAAERRVAAIEAQLRGARSAEAGADVEEVHRYLLAALTRANCVGPRMEPVPVVLDDPFARVPAERKWELMDLLCRLADKVQLLYLTDDPFVGAWARRRADADLLTLLEPVE